MDKKPHRKSRIKKSKQSVEKNINFVKSMDNNGYQQKQLTMRLSEFEIETIKSLARNHFGSDVQVFLFGSRTINQQRGGDIDLFIRNPNGSHLNTRTKINFLTDLILQIGEQKIDVILDNPDKQNSVFFKTIHQTGIQLC